MSQRQPVIDRIAEAIANALPRPARGLHHGGLCPPPVLSYHIRAAHGVRDLLQPPTEGVQWALEAIDAARRHAEAGDMERLHRALEEMESALEAWSVDDPDKRN